MHNKKPGLMLLWVGLLSLIFSLGLAACGDSIAPDVNLAATSTALPATATITATAPAQTTAAQTTSVPTTSIPTTGVPITSVPATGDPATPTQPAATTVDVTPGKWDSQATTVPNTPAPGKSTPTVPAATPTVSSKTAAASGAYPGKIVYDTADNQIFIIKPDGTGRKKVVDGFSPLFSPDGQRIAYLTRTEGSPLDSRLTLNTVKLDGTDHQKLCGTAGNVAGKLVRWSPRNRFIALTLTQSDGPGTLYLCNIADGSLNKGLTTPQGMVAEIYDWTLDGDNAVWQTGKGLDFNLYYGDPDKGGNGAIALTKGQNRAVSEVNQYQYYTAARISPDGKTLAIGGGSLYFIALPGQQSRLNGQSYIGAQVQSLAWSPDSRAIVMLSYEPALDKPVAVITIQDVSDQPGAPKALILDQNIGTSVDWSRQ